jgi:hypothetical protein
MQNSPEYYQYYQFFKTLKMEHYGLQIAIFKGTADEIGVREEGV